MGKALFFVKEPLLIKILVNMLEAVEVWGNHLFKYLPIIIFFGKTYLKKKTLAIQHYTCCFIWILTCIWSIALCKITLLQESEMRPTDWTPSFGKKGRHTFSIGCQFTTRTRYRRRWADNCWTRWLEPRGDYLLHGNFIIKPQFTTRTQRQHWGQLRSWLYRTCFRGAECLVDIVKDNCSQWGADRLSKYDTSV